MAHAKHTLVQQAFELDFTLPQSGRRGLGTNDVVRLSQFLSSRSYPVAYTAFDGDHFALTPLMRSFVLSHDVVPANPESILGYKDTVDKHQTKAGVLRDDLAVLRGCDQLWVFTDVEPSPASIGLLAEGVLIEIVYFVLSRGEADISFVSAVDILLGRSPRPVEVRLNLALIEAHLEPKQFSQILDFVGGEGLLIKDHLPATAFIAMDPLDSKYMSWIRPYALSRSQVAVVPGLAIELGDVLLRKGEMGCLLVSWVNLMRLASELWILPSMEAGRDESNTVALLKASWSARHSSRESKIVDWKSIGVPKALQGRAWPLTVKEGGVQ